MEPFFLSTNPDLSRSPSPTTVPPSKIEDNVRIELLSTKAPALQSEKGISAALSLISTDVDLMTNSHILVNDGSSVVVGAFSGAPAPVVEVELKTVATPEAPTPVSPLTIRTTDADGSPDTAPFIPSLGAWVKPLKIAHSGSETMKSLFQDVSSNRLKELSSHWPTITAGTQLRMGNKKHKHEQGANIRPSKLNVETPTVPKFVAEEISPPALKEDGSLRFPWAAKMNPSIRNLYRTTTPTYMEDGTPKVTIPSHILLHGADNQKEYVIGQFYPCSTPPGGLIHAVVNRIWGRKCRIFAKKLGESSYLFHIPDEPTRSWVLQRGLWHVDDCLMFVAEWSPAATLSLPEIATVPVWVTLKNIPNRLYSSIGISRIASGLGEPMLTNKPWLDPTLMGEAKIMVEIELDKPLPQKVALDDKKGTITMVDVEYSWIPRKCGKCCHLGHKESRCLQQSVTAPSTSVEISHVVTSVPFVQDKVLDAEHAPIVNPAVHPTSAHPTTISVPASEIKVSLLKICSDDKNESKSVDPNIDANSDDLISLATISILENLASQSAPTIICINESIEAPISESTQILTVTGISTSFAQETSTVERESSRIVESDFGSNMFASLISLEEEDDSSDSNKEMNSMDFMTPSGKRILRERPVKPSAKARELHLQSIGRVRGNRGRGNRGGHG